MTITRFITVGKKTQGHEAILKAKGFECSVFNGTLEIQATEVVEGVIDLSTPEKATEVLADMLAQHKVFSYRTHFIISNKGELEEVWGMLACGKLGKVSCLVTKGEVTRQLRPLDDIFDIL